MVAQIRELAGWASAKQRRKVHRQDLVEELVAEIRVDECRREDGGASLVHVGGVTAGGCRRHLRRPIQRDDATALESLTYERDGNAVAAPELENPVVRPDVELIDRPGES